MTSFILGRSESEVREQMKDFFVTPKENNVGISPPTLKSPPEPSKRALSFPRGSVNTSVDTKEIDTEQELSLSLNGYEIGDAWENAWFSMLSALQVDREVTMQLNSLYFLPRWIFERHQVRTFDHKLGAFDLVLIEALQSILPSNLHSQTVFLAASISARSISLIRSSMFHQTNQLLLQGAKQAEDLPLYVNRKLEDLRDQLGPLLKCFSKVKESRESIDILEKRQIEFEVNLLRKFCSLEPSEREKQSQNPGNYLVINTFDKSPLPAFEVRSSPVVPGIMRY
jgi:hypothetical protein